MRSRNYASGTALGLALLVAGLGCRSVAMASSPRPTEEANITKLATGLLEQSQFEHHPFDAKLAGTFLDRYLDSLDGSRSVFLQSDIAEFAAYRTNLADATRKDGDTRFARAIFARYLARLSQRVAYLGEALRTATFDFTGHDVYSFDREHAERPRDLAAAEALWRQTLRADYLQEKLGDKPAKEIVTTLTRRYQQQLRTMKNFNSEQVLELYLDTLAHVYDPHSDYLGREQMESLSIAMNLSLFGIGATLEEADGYCKIRELVAGGPAMRSGLLKSGDRIVAVGQSGQEPVDVIDMPLTRVVELVRGAKGSTVNLKIIPAGAADGSVPVTASLVRDEIKLEDQEAKARIVDLPASNGAVERLGVIDLPSFYSGAGSDRSQRRSATADVAKLLAKLEAEGVRGIVLDLRRNGGGSLEEAINLTGLFIRRGPIVQTRDHAGDIDVGSDTDSTIQYDGPLLVLTSRFSASASEILAGALQDYQRAIIVGDPTTFGKGTVQTIVPLARMMDQAGIAHASDPGALKVTVSKFYRPSGASTQLRGVASDIVIPSTTDVVDVSESALKDPLPWDVIPPAAYDRLNRVRSCVDTLRRRSEGRVSADKDFGHLVDDASRLKKTIATKSVSLNEAERRVELARDKERLHDLVREARDARAADPTTYEITLKNASLPGLPAPVDRNKETTSGSDRVGSIPSGHADDAAMNASTIRDLVSKESLRILADYAEISRQAKE